MTAPAAPAGPAPAAPEVSTAGGQDGPAPSLDAITVMGEPPAAPAAPAPAAAPPAVFTAPAAPVAPAAPAATAPQAAAATPEPGANAGWKVEDLPPGAQEYIKTIRNEAAKNRAGLVEQTKRTEAVDERLSAFTAGLAKALGYGPEEEAGPPDPEKLSAELGTRTGELTASQDLSRKLTAQLAVWQQGATHGANVPELMDSASFLNTLGGLDPTAADFNEKLGAAVLAAVTANPRFKAPAAQAAAAAPSGAQFSGGPGGQLNPEDASVEDMVIARYAEATKSLSK